MSASQLGADRMAAQLERLQQEVDRLRPTEDVSSVTAMLERALAELSVTVEELRVAEEEMRDQTDALASVNVDLEAERRRYQDLFHAAPEGYLVTDAAGTVREANLAAGALLRRPPERLVGKPFALYLERSSQTALRALLTDLAAATEPRAWDLTLDGDGLLPLEVACRVAPVRHTVTGELLELRWFLHDITDRKRAEAEARDARQRLAEVSNRMEAVREAERRRIAQTVHDEIGAALTAIKINVTQVRQGLEKLGAGRAGGEALLAHTDGAVRLIDETMQTVRRIAMEMRPAILDDFGLVAALDWQLNEFQKRTQLRCRFHVRPGNTQVDPAVATAVFRVFQEALTNVARHAAASRVMVRLYEDAQHLVLTVHDNGVGLEPGKAEAHTSMGLQGMRERVRQFGGTVDFISKAGEGTLVRVKVPLGGAPALPAAEGPVAPG